MESHPLFSGPGSNYRLGELSVECMPFLTLQNSLLPAHLLLFLCSQVTAIKLFLAFSMPTCPTDILSFLFRQLVASKPTMVSKLPSVEVKKNLDSGVWKCSRDGNNVKAQ